MNVFIWTETDDLIHKIITDWVLSEFYGTEYSKVSYEVWEKNIYIYTPYPGVLIGKEGKTVEKLKSALKENGINKGIKFLYLSDDINRVTRLTNIEKE